MPIDRQDVTRCNVSSSRLARCGVEVLRNGARNTTVDVGSFQAEDAQGIGREVLGIGRERVWRAREARLPGREARRPGREARGISQEVLRIAREARRIGREVPRIGREVRFPPVAAGLLARPTVRPPVELEFRRVAFRFRAAAGISLPEGETRCRSKRSR